MDNIESIFASCNNGVAGTIFASGVKMAVEINIEIFLKPVFGTYFWGFTSVFGEIRYYFLIIFPKNKFLGSFWGVFGKRRKDGCYGKEELQGTM